MKAKYHLTLKFEGDGFNSAEKAAFMMALERWARQHTGKPVEVFLQRLVDDLRPRRLMTQEERDKL